MPKSKSGPWPSTDASITMLVRPGIAPRVTASAKILKGSESVFALVEVDTMRPGEPERHSAHFSLIGDRASVLDVIRQLRAAVDAAQPSAPEE